MLNQYLALLTAPATFFRKYASKHGFRDAWTFYIVFTLISSLISLPFLAIQSIADSTLASELVFFVLGILGALVAPFLSAAIPHLGLMLLGSRGYDKTFRPIAYSDVVTVPYWIGVSILEIIGLIAGVDTILTVDIEFTPGAIILVTLAVLLIIASVVHRIYASCVGLALEHRISKVRAFCGAYLIPWAILMLIGLVVAMFFFTVLVALFAGSM